MPIDLTDRLDEATRVANRTDAAIAAPPTLGSTPFARSEPAGALTSRSDSGIITANSVSAARGGDTQRPAIAAPSVQIPGVGADEGLQRTARANQIRGEMIDSMIKADGGNGVAVLKDRNAEWNDQMRRQGEIQQITDAMARNPHLANAMSGALAQTVSGHNHQAAEAFKQKAVMAGLDIQRRGQDMNFGAQMAQMGLSARSKDQDAAMGNAKLGIDMAKFGLEQSAMQRQQSAQDNLFRAMESGDQNAISRARTLAVAAGVKLPEETKLQTVQTDSGFMVFNPLNGEVRPAVGQGGQALGSAKPLTEAQAKASGYGARAAESSRIIEEVGQGGKVQPSMVKRAAESIPLIGEGLAMAANKLASPEQQQVEQGQRDFINAVLRQESGAVISDAEFANARKQYFPEPGDSSEVIEQKRANREAAINGFRISAGPGARNIGSSPAQAAKSEPATPQPSGVPKVGTVDGKHVFLGGNPADPASWAEVR